MSELKYFKKDFLDNGEYFKEFNDCFIVCVYGFEHCFRKEIFFNYEEMKKEAIEYINHPKKTYKLQFLEKRCGNCKNMNNLYKCVKYDHEVLDNGVCDLWEGVIENEND